tara:strand:- start:2371 stop:2778 length:408 start_codon:yes stop_codon:yes gene_type:complete
VKINLERIDSGYGMLAKAGSHQVYLDNSEEFGGKDIGFRPMQLMLISLAGCSAIDIIYILEKGRYTIRNYSSEVRAARREEMPKIFEKIELIITVDTDASDEVLARALQLTKTKYCSAFAVLEASAAVNLSVVRG